MYRVERCIINRGYLELSDYYLWEDNFRTVVKILIKVSCQFIYYFVFAQGMVTLTEVCKEIYPLMQKALKESVKRKPPKSTTTAS